MSKKARNEFQKLQYEKPRESTICKFTDQIVGLMKKAWALNLIFAFLVVKLDMGWKKMYISGPEMCLNLYISVHFLFVFCCILVLSGFLPLSFVSWHCVRLCYQAFTSLRSGFLFRLETCLTCFLNRACVKYMFDTCSSVPTCQTPTDEAHIGICTDWRSTGLSNLEQR